MEIDGSPDDLPMERRSSLPAEQGEGNLGNPTNNGSEPGNEQHLSPSRKRKVGDEKDTGIAPHEPALKVLHLQEQDGDQSRGHQSDLIVSTKLGVDAGAGIEFKDSHMNPHRSHLEALLGGENRPDDFNNDALSALRAYAESPSPEENDFPTVSFSNALDSTLGGLPQSQEISLVDMDNVLSASLQLQDLKGEDGPAENLAEDGPQVCLMDAQLEAPGVVDVSPKDESQVLVSDFQSGLQAPHLGEAHLEGAALHISDSKFELEAAHVLENRVDDETQLGVSNPQLELDALYGKDQARMQIDDPQPELEALQVEERDSEPQLEPLYVEEGDSRPHLEPLYAEESDPRPQLEALLAKESTPQPELEALRVEESNVQPEFGALQENSDQPEFEALQENGVLQPEFEALPENSVFHPEIEALEGNNVQPEFGVLQENSVQSEIENLQESSVHPEFEALQENSVQPEFEALRVVASEALLGVESDPQPALESLAVKESGAVHEIQLRLDDPQSEMEPQNAVQSSVQDEIIPSRSDPETELGALSAAESAVEDEPVVSVVDPETELEDLPIVEDGVESDNNVFTTDPQSELAALPAVDNVMQTEANLSEIDPQPESEAMQLEETAAGQAEAGTVEDVSDPLAELDVEHMEVTENSGDDESQIAAKKRKLVLLAAVAAFFSTLAGAVGSIGELVGQLEKTAMAGISLDRDGHLERNADAGTTSTSTSTPSPLGESTAVRLHSAMTRSSSSLSNNIIVSMFLLMQQHRKRSQKRPRELTGPWYIKPRSAQAFESFLDFSPQGDPDKFRELFRISPSLFFHICDMVRDEMLSDTPRSLRVLPNRVLTVERQVAIAIRRLATGNQFLGIADSIGVSKSTAVKVTWKFIVAFIKKARSQHLQWPNVEQMQRIKDGFKTQWGFPNCCGVVDGTHFTVEFPKGEDVSQYYDHQNHVSISMQAIVGHDQRFLDVVVGWPGSVQEYQLLQNTNFFRTVNTNERLNGESYTTQDGGSLREYILGDAGYPLYDWLMVPYPGGLSAAKDEWNSRHAVAKQCVEDALVRLKGTWKILSRILWKPRKERIGKMVFACCLLHNMIIERQDGLSPDVYAGVNPHPGGYTGVSIPTAEVFEGGPEAREVLFREVMGGGIV